MEQLTEQSTSTELVELALRDLADGNTDQLREALTEVHPAETADVLEAMPPEQHSATWELVPEADRGEILAHVHDEARSSLIGEMDHSDLVNVAGQMTDKDLAEVLDVLPVDLTESVLGALDDDHRPRIETVLSYPEGTAGRLMSTDVISVRSTVTLAVVLAWLRHHQRLPPHTDTLMVLSNEGHYQGKLDIADVVTGAPDVLVADVMKPEAGGRNGPSHHHRSRGRSLVRAPRSDLGRCA